MSSALAGSCGHGTSFTEIARVPHRYSRSYYRAHGSQRAGCDRDATSKRVDGCTRAGKRFRQATNVTSMRVLRSSHCGRNAWPADIARVASAIKSLAPELCWRSKASDDPAFANGHANADILGSVPEALEQRDDVWIGLSLMAPGITYPDHSHPPEEVYLALSRGFWRHEASAWHEPGLGGIVYNPRGITHAMRSSCQPFLAIWCLPID